MDSSTASQREQSIISPPRNLELVNWPLRDDQARAGAMIAGSTIAAACAGLVASSAVVALVAWAALQVSLWRLWIPVRFELGPKGIVQVCWGRKRRIPWSAIHCCEIRRRGILLLPGGTGGAFSVLHGLYLRWGTQRAQLLTLVKYYLGSRVVG